MRAVGGAQKDASAEAFCATAARSAVSVLAPPTMDSEAWTKPFFINGCAWTSAHKPAGFRVCFCEDRPQATCGWLP